MKIADMGGDAYSRTMLVSIYRISLFYLSRHGCPRLFEDICLHSSNSIVRESIVWSSLPLTLPMLCNNQQRQSGQVNKHTHSLGYINCNISLYFSHPSTSSYQLLAAFSQVNSTESRDICAICTLALMLCNNDPQLLTNNSSSWRRLGFWPDSSTWNCSCTKYPCFKQCSKEQHTSIT